MYCAAAASGAGGLRAAEPVGLRAAACGAGGLIRSALPVLGHLHELGLLGDKGAVSSNGSTVHVVGAAEPVGLRAAASRARGLIRSALPVLGHLHELGFLGDKGAVSSSGSTVHVVRAAEPVGLWAAASGAGGLIRSTLPVLCHLHELGLLGDKGAVSSGGSTVHVVRAAEPVGLRAAASGAGGLIRSTLPVLGHLHELGLLGDKGAVSSGGSTVH